MNTDAQRLHKTWLLVVFGENFMWVNLLKSCRIALAFPGLLLLVAETCEAWSGAGHMAIAAGAYSQLSNALKARVDLLLKSHPDYEDWRESYAGESAGIDLELFVFMKASKWPDEIRRKNNKYDHPHWHYVNYPLKAPGFKAEARPAPDDDILFGIGQSEKVIAGKNASPELRAVHISWLVHLLGDLHQPLHCGNLVNATFPDGDKGGNDFYVKPAKNGVRLHSFWDGLLGTRNQARPQLNYAVQILKSYPKWRLRERKHKRAEEWSLESRTLAVEKVYLKGKLESATDPESARALPTNYAKAAKSVAERQAALAMYRLADELTRCLE